MPDSSSKNGEAARIDFASSASSGPLIFDNRLQADGVTLVQCRAPANPTGSRVVSPQTTIVVPTGPAFELDWQAADSDCTQTSMISRGRVMVYAGGVPVWKRWHGTPSILVMALGPKFLETIRQQVFEPNNGSTLRTAAGIDDPIADELVRLAGLELGTGGAHGRLYIESLATTLAVHVLHNYGAEKAVVRRTGGLDPVQLRRVLDYIEAHIPEDLGLSTLASIAGLSPDHFGDAFKTATGLAPYQYALDRRVARACELLLRDRAFTVTQVALMVGFSSQSHLTTQFKRVMGVTPARFRRLST